VGDGVPVWARGVEADVSLGEARDGCGVEQDLICAIKGVMSLSGGLLVS
jgi:hypothetical protein